MIESEMQTKSLEHIENLCICNYEFNTVLRLLIIYSAVENGILPEAYDNLKSEIINSYGFENIIKLRNIEKLGLIKKYEGKFQWKTLKENLNLLNTTYDENNPDDFSYIFLAYAPLTCRLVEETFKQGWQYINREMDLIKGPSIFTNEKRVINPNHKNK